MESPNNRPWSSWVGKLSYYSVELCPTIILIEPLNGISGVPAMRLPFKIHIWFASRVRFAQFKIRFPKIVRLFNFMLLVKVTLYPSLITASSLSFGIFLFSQGVSVFQLNVPMISFFPAF